MSATPTKVELKQRVDEMEEKLEVLAEFVARLTHAVFGDEFHAFDDSDGRQHLVWQVMDGDDDPEPLSDWVYRP